MNKILYLHGFASSSESNKAKLFRKTIVKQKLNYQCITPDLPNNISEAFKLIENLIMDNKPRFIIGSSLGGFYSTYFAEKFNLKSILLNPAVLPANGMKIYLGENENYSTGEKFIITPEDIRYIRKMSHKKYANAENTYVLLESGDEVLNYKETAKYFSGSYIDVIYGGSHSYESLDEKLNNITNFIEIY